jgi:NAD dependent epimerase/dehydratase family enzyme
MGRAATSTDQPSGRPSAARVCGDWERAAVQAERFGVRVVRLRIGLVLGAGGGMLARMLIPFEWLRRRSVRAGNGWLDGARRPGAADRRRDANRPSADR